MFKTQQYKLILNYSVQSAKYIFIQLCVVAISVHYSFPIIATHFSDTINISSKSHIHHRKTNPSISIRTQFASTYTNSTNDRVTIFLFSINLFHHIQFNRRNRTVLRLVFEPTFYFSMPVRRGVSRWASPLLRRIVNLFFVLAKAPLRYPVTLCSLDFRTMTYARLPLRRRTHLRPLVPPSSLHTRLLFVSVLFCVSCSSSATWKCRNGGFLSSPCISSGRFRFACSEGARIDFLFRW